MIEIIPKKCIDILPLSPEPIASWNKQSDLLMFLVEMYKLDGYASYGKHLFEEGLKRWDKTLIEFRDNAVKATPAPAAEEQAEPIPNFKSDSYLGLMAKYSIAWHSADEAVLSESAFFSLAHVLEAGSELESSILLAANLYYKQALQVLRNYIEGMVVQLYFCDNLGDFEAWQEGTYKVPSLRGKGGMLEVLESGGLLPTDLSKLASDLYGDLNGSIHGAERRLLHTGVFEGKWAGCIFKYERFKEWCECFARCVDVGIRILRLSSNLWLNTRPQDRIVCDVCHNAIATEFEIDKSELNAGTVSFRCKRCGSIQHYKATWAIQHGY